MPCCASLYLSIAMTFGSMYHRHQSEHVYAVASTNQCHAPPSPRSLALGLTLPLQFVSARNLAMPRHIITMPCPCESSRLLAYLCLYVSRPFTAVTNQSTSIPSLRRGSLRPCDFSRFRTAPWLFCAAVDFALADQFNTMPLPSIAIRDLSTPSHVATILSFTAAKPIFSRLCYATAMPLNSMPQQLRTQLRYSVTSSHVKRP